MKTIFLMGGFFILAGFTAFKRVEMKRGQKAQWSLFEESHYWQKHLDLCQISQTGDQSPAKGSIEDLKLGSIFYLHALSCFLFDSVWICCCCYCRCGQFALLQWFYLVRWEEEKELDWYSKANIANVMYHLFDCLYCWFHYYCKKSKSCNIKKPSVWIWMT